MCWSALMVGLREHSASLGTLSMQLSPLQCSVLWTPSSLDPLTPDFASSALEDSRKILLLASMWNLPTQPTGDDLAFPCLGIIVLHCVDAHYLLFSVFCPFVLFSILWCCCFRSEGKSILCYPLETKILMLFTHLNFCSASGREVIARCGFNLHFSNNICPSFHFEVSIWVFNMFYWDHCLFTFDLLFCCLLAQSWPALCDPIDCSMPGFPVLHHLLEFAQTHVHWVSDAFQSSCPLSSPSPPAFSLSQH